MALIKGLKITEETTVDWSKIGIDKEFKFVGLRVRKSSTKDDQKFAIYRNYCLEHGIPFFGWYVWDTSVNDNIQAQDLMHVYPWQAWDINLLLPFKVYDMSYYIPLADYMGRVGADFLKDSPVKMKVWDAGNGEYVMDDSWGLITKPEIVTPDPEDPSVPPVTGSLTEDEKLIMLELIARYFKECLS